jgi:hypothetical protein
MSGYLYEGSLDHESKSKETHDEALEAYYGMYAFERRNNLRDATLLTAQQLRMKLKHVKDSPFAPEHVERATKDELLGMYRSVVGFMPPRKSRGARDMSLRTGGPGATVTDVGAGDSCWQLAEDSSSSDEE